MSSKLEPSGLEKFVCPKRDVSGINIDPLQRGGILTPQARDALLEWGDGYSVCDFCAGEMDRIKSPPIEEFVHGVLPEFLQIDEVRITHGAREGMYAAMNSLCDRGEALILDANAHYTSVLAAERSGLYIEYVQNSGAPGYSILASGYQEAIERVNDSGLRIGMAVLTYPDGNYGNLADVKAISSICHDEGIPFMVNAAYSVGRMPVYAKDIGADIIVASGHKSMASSGPIGLLGASEEYAGRIFRRSPTKKNKEVELLGCTVRGAGLLTMMASFPAVVERIAGWDAEVEKARAFSKDLEALGMVQHGDRPHNHDLMFFTSEALYQISQRVKKGRYFLYSDLKKRGIHGIKSGLTRQFKLSTYQLSSADLARVVSAFREILEAYPSE